MESRWPTGELAKRATTLEIGVLSQPSTTRLQSFHSQARIGLCPVSPVTARNTRAGFAGSSLVRRHFPATAVTRIFMPVSSPSNAVLAILRSPGNRRRSTTTHSRRSRWPVLTARWRATNVTRLSRNQMDGWLSYIAALRQRARLVTRVSDVSKCCRELRHKTTSLTVPRVFARKKPISLSCRSVS
jgi:hypothetical protein